MARRRTLCSLLTVTFVLALAPNASAGDSATKWIDAGADTWVRQGLTTSQYSTTYLRTGLANGYIHRSLVRFPQTAITEVKGKNVLSARLYLFDTGAGACDRAVDAYRLTSGFGSTTVWGNQPTASGLEGRTTNTAGNSACAPGGDWIGIPITKATIDGWANGTVPYYGLLVRAANEGDGLAWRVFSSVEATSGNRPRLAITYNTPPDVPNLIEPAANASGPCNPTLTASFADAEGGEGRVDFRVLDSAGAVVTSGSANSSAGRASWQVPRNADGTCKLADGQSYKWDARAYDGRDYSAPSGQQTYTVRDAVTFDGSNTAAWPAWHACDRSRFSDLATDPTGVWSSSVMRIEVHNSDTNANPACVDEPTDNPRTWLVGPSNIEGDAIDRTGDTASVTFEGFSAFIPASWPAYIPDWISLYEDYGPPYAGAGDVRTLLDDGGFRSPESNGNYNWVAGWSTPMDALRGHWVNIVQEVKRSYDDRVGYVRQWYSTDRNALQPTTFVAGKGCASVSADALTCYKNTFGTSMDDGMLSPRIGIYHAKTLTTPDPLTTYFRAFKQGKTMDAVDPTKVP